MSQAVADGRLSELALDATYRLFLLDNRLMKDDGAPLPAVPDSITGRPEGRAEHLLLRELRDTRSINALPDDSRLRFSMGLTVVYGRNGSGKTGFFRVLSASCFSRNRDRDVLPDVLREGGAATPPSATLLVSEGDGAPEEVPFPSVPPDPRLQSISVFDAAVAVAHLAQRNAFAFTPAGFDVLTELARVYGEISARLKAREDALDGDNPFTDLLVGEEATPASDLMRSLSADTDPGELAALGTFGEAERSALRSTADELAALRARSPEQLIGEARRNLQDLKHFREQLASSSGLWNAAAVSGFGETLETYRAHSALASAESLESLAVDGVPVGSDAWQAFVRAAAELGGAEYPRPGDPCLLCHRKLDEDALGTIRRTWTHLRGDARQSAANAMTTLHRAAERMEEADLHLLPESSRLHAFLEAQDPALRSRLSTHLESLRNHRDALVRSLREGTGPLEVPGAPACDADLDAVEAALASRIAALEREDVQALIADAAQRHAALRHRELLAGNLARAKARVAALRWVGRSRELRSRSLRPTAVTRKEKELARDLLGDDYIEGLQSELAAVGCGHLALHTLLAGSQGTTVRSLKLDGTDTPPVKVLSEGEQRAVALADFLAEVALNPAGSGIILDDPVSNLDQERKERIARRLVGEATMRQVVVFTHDLEFLSLLREEGKRVGNLEVMVHRVRRSGDVDGPGLVSHDEGPLAAGGIGSSAPARELWERAMTESGTRRVDTVREGFGALRTALEYLVYGRLLNDVVAPYRRRVKVGSLRTLRWSEDLRNEVADAHDAVSSLIDASLRPDGAPGTEPTPADLKRFIDDLDGLNERVTEHLSGRS